MDFFAVLLNNNGASRGTGICGEYHSIPELDPYDGGSCFLVGDCFDVFAVEKGIPG